MKKVLALLVAMILCVSLFASCGEKISTPDDKKLNSTVVLKAGDVEITQAYYNFIHSIIYAQMAQYEQYYGEDWLNMEIESGKTVENYIDESAKLQSEQFAAAIILGEEYGIAVDDKIKEDVKGQKKDVVESYGGEEGYIQFLKDSHTTDEAITTYLETYEVLSALLEKITKKGEEGYIEESEVEKMFLEEYKDKLRVQHVLISTQADEATGAVAKSDEEALKIANQVIAKLDKGEEFDTLIADYGEDPGMSAGQFYTFGTGEMVEEFEKASRELKVGEYTKKPVKSDYGYHIIKRYAIDKEIPEYADFKLVKEQEKLTDILVKRSEKLDMKWEDKKVDAYLKEWKKEREEAKKQAESAE